MRGEGLPHSFCMLWAAAGGGKGWGAKAATVGGGFDSNAPRRYTPDVVSLCRVTKEKKKEPTYENPSNGQ